MYCELDKSSHFKFLGIQESQVPHSLIMYGGWNPPQSMLEWQEKADFRTAKFFYPLAIHDGIAVTSSYGDAMGSEIAHIFSVIGVERIILIGTFGATKAGIDYGDIFMPDRAVSEDGASRAYNSNPVSHPDPTLLKIAHELWRDHKVHIGTIVSTSAMLAESWEIITDWQAKGYAGVDLETSCVFSVANHFGIPAVAIHTLADNLVEKHTVLDLNISQRLSKRQAKQEIFTRALTLIELHRSIL